MAFKLSGVEMRTMLRRVAVVAGVFFASSHWCMAEAYVMAPLVPQPKARGAVVGLVLQNPGTNAIPVRLITFGEVFSPGQVAEGASLKAKIGRTVEAVQADVKNRYSDGSIKFAVLTMESPVLAPGADVPVMLRLAKRGKHAAPVDLPKAVARNNVAVTIDHGGRPITIQAADMLREAMANHSASPWLTGPLVTEVRVARRVSGSLRLVMDLRAYRGGTFEADIQFNNDIAMRRHGGPVRYGVIIRRAGHVVYARNEIMQYQYQDWHVVVRSDGRTPINIIHDVAAMERARMIPAYELKYGVLRRVFQTEARKMAAPGWRAPLAANGVFKYMPNVGGRWDIGPTTTANATWLISQRPIAVQYALDQADAAGAVPWHMFNLSTGTFVTTDDYPRLWTDPRGGPRSGTQGLTQKIPSQKECGWHAEDAHEPDLSFIPYLMTGRRYYLDQLDAEASWDETSFWPAPVARNNGEGVVVGPGNQLRGAAWSLREIADAAYIDPDGSKLKAYFRHMVENNLRFLLRNIPSWTKEEGEAYGWVPSANGRPLTNTAPWQNDFFATTIGLMAARGDGQAKQVLVWLNHFLSGRFLSADRGFNPHNGIVYELSVRNAHTGEDYTTWHEIEEATIALGRANGNGWGQSNGYYGQTALAALASVINVTNDPSAWRAYRWLIHSGAPYVSAASFARQPQYWIVPMPRQ